MDNRNKNTKNIPVPPSHVEIHYKSEYKPTSPPKKIIPAQEFHEGHQKDIPDSKDFMEHKKFENLKHVADEHLGGPIEPHEHTSTTTTTTTTETHKEGVWDKTKESIKHGFDKIKNMFK